MSKLLNKYSEVYYESTKEIVPTVISITLLCSQSDGCIPCPCSIPPGSYLKPNYLSGCSADAFKSAIPQAEGAYVANSNTGKFHFVNCRYVAKMSPGHKVYYDSREEAAGDGYVACKVCRP